MLTKSGNAVNVISSVGTGAASEVWKDVIICHWLGFDYWHFTDRDLEYLDLRQ